MPVCSMFFWFFSGNKGLGTEGSRELGRTPWVDSSDLLNSSCCIWLLVRICYQFLIHQQSPVSYVFSLPFLVLVLYLFDAVLVQQGSMSSFSLRWVHVHLLLPDTLVLSTCIMLVAHFSTSFGTRCYLLSIYRNGTPQSKSPNYCFLLIQKL